MEKQTNNDSKSKQAIPPVVAVLGHVDHGKTSLLDAIRKSSLADREYGGITQSIGASAVETMYEGKSRKITFIDTPGHEAFSAMRSRGAQAADIGLLIVSAVDGVKPQTRESIELLKAANIPYIVVLTMADLPTKNPEKVKQHIIRENIMLEGYGGDVPVIEVSSKTNQNIKELLDLILLVSEMREVNMQADSQGKLKAIVIESKLDPKVGAKATLIVKNGTITTRDELRGEGHIFKVRSLINHLGKQVPQVSVGDGVEVIGATQVLSVGSIITSAKDAELEKDKKETLTNSLQDFAYHKSTDNEGLFLLLIADTQGSLEAIEAALPKKVTIVAKKTGEITEADVLQAKATGAIALSFNTKIRSDVEKLAMAEKVLIKNYKIIYEMLDEINDVLEGKRQMNLEIILGKAKVLARFPFEKSYAYGVALTEGRLANKDKIRVIRDDQIIGETTIKSLRFGKNPVPKITKGEAGLVLGSELDINTGDMIISFA